MKYHPLTELLRNEAALFNDKEERYDQIIREWLKEKIEIWNYEPINLDKLLDLTHETLEEKIVDFMHNGAVTSLSAPNIAQIAREHFKKHPEELNDSNT